MELEPTLRGFLYVRKSKGLLQKWKECYAAVYGSSSQGVARVEVYASENDFWQSRRGYFIVLKDAVSVKNVPGDSKFASVIQLICKNESYLLATNNDFEILETWKMTISEAAFGKPNIDSKQLFEIDSIDGMKSASEVGQSGDQEGGYPDGGRVSDDEPCYEAPWDTQDIPVKMLHTEASHMDGLFGEYDLAMTPEGLILKRNLNIVKIWGFSDIHRYGTGTDGFAMETTRGLMYEFQCSNPRQTLDRIRSYIPLSPDVDSPMLKRVSEHRQVYTEYYKTLRPNYHEMRLSLSSIPSVISDANDYNSANRDYRDSITNFNRSGPDRKSAHKLHRSGSQRSRSSGKVRGESPLIERREPPLSAQRGTRSSSSLVDRRVYPQQNRSGTIAYNEHLSPESDRAYSLSPDVPQRQGSRMFGIFRRKSNRSTKKSQISELESNVELDRSVESSSSRLSSWFRRNSTEKRQKKKQLKASQLAGSNGRAEFDYYHHGGESPADRIGSNPGEIHYGDPAFYRHGYDIPYPDEDYYPPPLVVDNQLFDQPPTPDSYRDRDPRIQRRYDDYEYDNRPPPKLPPKQSAERLPEFVDKPLPPPRVRQPEPQRSNRAPRERSLSRNDSINRRIPTDRSANNERNKIQGQGQYHPIRDEHGQNKPIRDEKVRNQSRKDDQHIKPPPMVVYQPPTRDSQRYYQDRDATNMTDSEGRQINDYKNAPELLSNFRSSPGPIAERPRQLVLPPEIHKGHQYIPSQYELAQKHNQIRPIAASTSPTKSPSATSFNQASSATSSIPNDFQIAPFQPQKSARKSGADEPDYDEAEGRDLEYDKKKIDQLTDEYRRKIKMITDQSPSRKPGNRPASEISPRQANVENGGIRSNQNVGNIPVANQRTGKPEPDPRRTILMPPEVVRRENSNKLSNQRLGKQMSLPSTRRPLVEPQQLSSRQSPSGSTKLGSPSGNQNGSRIPAPMPPMRRLNAAARDRRSNLSTEV